VFVFCDPRNWGLDIQIMIDVLRARGGVIGAPYRDRDELHEVELIFCNPDLLWRNDFPRHRFGQGVFKEAFQSVYKVRGRT
jgi:ribonucleotide monophosphatase NagD (HAD superfamily)